MKNKHYSISKNNNIKKAIINKKQKINMAKQEKIKTRTFEIPKALLGEFFTQLEENELEYELVEVNQDDDELEITVTYSEHQKGNVMDLIELVDDYFSENEEEENENDED